MKACTYEQEQKIIELKKNLTTNSDIVRLTGISLYFDCEFSIITYGGDVASTWVVKFEGACRVCR
jgi:hypothetical protein